MRMNMKCPQCTNQLRKVFVRIHDAQSKVISYQCGKCFYFDFEETTIKIAIREIETQSKNLGSSERTVISAA